MPDIDDSEERIGPFPSWTALYITVVLYSIGLIALLSYLTVRLDFS
jgi:hypothetical protein